MRRGLHPSIKPGLLLAILLVAFASTGCRTTVGNYLGNRGGDFGDYVPVQASLDVELGAFVKPAGPVHMASLR